MLFWRKRLNEKAVKKILSVQCIGRIPFESTFSMRTLNLAGCRRDHSRQEESREIIGDDHTGPLAQFMQESFACIWGRFQIRIVEDAGIFQPSRVVLHSLHYESVKPVRCPLIAASQSLQDHKRFAKSVGPLDCPLETEVPVRFCGWQSSSRGHNHLSGFPQPRYTSEFGNQVPESLSGPQKQWSVCQSIG